MFNLLQKFRSYTMVYHIPSIKKYMKKKLYDKVKSNIYIFNLLCKFTHAFILINVA